jgi:hypothetical protein
MVSLSCTLGIARDTKVSIKKKLFQPFLVRNSIIIVYFCPVIRDYLKLFKL